MARPSRTKEISEAFFADVVPMAEIGRRCGVTRERVRQCVEEADPDQKRRDRRGQWIADIESQERFEIELAELLRRASTATPCVVCGSWVLRRKVRATLTCSPECSEAWNCGGKYVLDDEHHKAHRIACAKNVLDRPRKASDMRWAKKMLSSNPPQPNRRYIVPGSGVHKRLLVALGTDPENWPEEFRPRAVVAHATEAD